MKKRVVFFILFFVLIIGFSLVSSQETETQKVNQSYICLKGKVEGKCSSLSFEEKIFSALAINECYAEIMAEKSTSEECWPSSGCTIELTAKAVLALKEVNKSFNSTGAQNWLLSKRINPESMEWFLEIDSPVLTSYTCSITSDTSSDSVTINADKTLSLGASSGTCLSLSPNNYWLKINPSCYGKNFTTSCTEDFITTLLFKKTTSDTIHVVSETHPAAKSGNTIEKVNSFCFSQTASCDYEGSLWASLILSSSYPTSSFLPYLITMADETQNLQFLPEAFLHYFLSNVIYPDIISTLLSKQNVAGYWEASSGNRYYDTALALYSLKYDNVDEKAKAKNWLLANQGVDKCWGNVRDTAFILFATWPELFKPTPPTPPPFPPDGELDCEDKGYFCLSKQRCEVDAKGKILANYSCIGTYVCCNQTIVEKTCEEQRGEICSSDETCSGTTASAKGLGSREVCCITGKCEKKEAPPTPPVPPLPGDTCEENNGSCRTNCEEGEEEVDYSCSFGDKCCIKKEISLAKTTWLLYVLGGLIILSLLGIVFRNKLRELWYKVSSRKGGGKPSISPFRFSPSSPPRTHLPLRRPVPRRPIGSAVSRRPRGEINDVLKKLKEMGGG